MKLLYSNMLPLGIEDNQITIADCIIEQMKKSDKIDIAVGYVSNASLEELDRLIEEYSIKSVTLIIGMYYAEGMPERTYRTAVRINEKWQESGIGEIRIVRSLQYHGKIYCFYKDEKPFAAVIGSANLGVLKLEAANRRQYESAVFTENADETNETAQLIERIKKPICSVNITAVDDMKLIREHNVSLTGIDTVEQLPPNSNKLYEKYKTDVSFVLPIKVPAFDERHLDDGKHYTKSNINVCYAVPRTKKKSRDWYETQMTVSKKITRLPGYPEKNVPFFVVTDDDYWFKAHTTSDGNKQFSAVGDELIIGRWLKGRIAAAGLVKPVNDSQKDTDRSGMITKEMLEEYGSNGLIFTKTSRTALDENGDELDVWTLSFTTVEDTEEEE